MKKIIIAALCVVAFANCGSWNRFVGSVTGYSRECVEGVTYLQFPSGATVQYDLSGRVVPCK